MGIFDFFKRKKEENDEIALDEALNIKEINEGEVSKLWFNGAIF